MADGQEPTTPTPDGQEPTGNSEPNDGGQEPQTFDREYVQTLRGEAAKHRTKVSDLERQLKEFQDRDKTDAEKLAERAEAAERAAAENAQKLLRFEVAAEKGLDPKVAALLNGVTREEMAESADLLLELAKPKVDPSTFDGGARITAPAGDMDSAIRAAHRRTRI